jgi:hypothetical protein
MNKFCLGLAILAALNGAAAPAMAAQACSKHSPAHGVALLELYTSEGCDSCPPADEFVSGLRAAGVTSEQAVLLSLHVDYWNYIGWKDRFSSAAFTERQRYLSDLAGSRTIYTPEMFIGGHELRGNALSWRQGVPQAVKRVNDKPAQADISIALGEAGAAGLPVQVTASAAGGGNLYIALVQNGLVSNIKAGENRGRVLHHDFVVREWLEPVALASLADGAKPAATLVRTLMLPAGAVPKNLAISAFVQSERGEVLQALALPVCGN